MGVSFTIPNEYGKYLSELLEPIPVNEYQWLITNDEIHIVENSKFTNEFLFREEDRIMAGERLHNAAQNNTYYLIFATLMAFSIDGIVKLIRTYKEFLESDCQIAISVYDCCYVMLWCKNTQLTLKLYNYAITKGWEDVEFISEYELINERYYMDT